MPEAAATTNNPVGHDIEAEARQILDVLNQGGVAIMPLNVAYAIVGRTEGAIRRIFEIKQRSNDKPSGMFGGIAASTDLHVLNDAGKALRQGLVENADLPFSIVADYRADSALLADVEPFVLQTSTKGPTMDMLLNAGPIHNALASLSNTERQPVFGSSANRSLSGSKYSVEDVEDEVLDAVDLVIDHGRCRDANPDGMSSTIIDFRDFTVVRKGCRFDEIAAYARDEHGIELKL